MRRLAIVVSYDGTAYNGFQTQPAGNTIQDCLERAIEHLTGERVRVTAAGRTDAGVHARRQVVHFDTASRIPAERWCLALNARLPDDIVALDAREVPADFHARRSAKSKTYAYTVNTNRFPDVLRRRTELHYPRPLDVVAMERALACIIGTHDFTSFCSARTACESRVRTIYAAWIERLGDRCPEMEGVYRIFVKGSGFLYHMVRMIVGTLLEIGDGRRDPSEMQAILEARDPRRSKTTAMAHGLALWDVEYEPDVFA